MGLNNIINEMKKYNISLLAVALIMAIVSCTKEKDNPEANSINRSQMKTVTLSAQIIQTKTTLDADHFKLVWSAGDKVSLFNDQDNTNAEVNYISGGDIVVEVPVATHDIYMLYPFNGDNTSGPEAADISIAANQIQTNPGQLNGYYYPMVAKGTVGVDNKAFVAFYPVAGALALNIYKSSLDGAEAVSSVTISVSNTGIVGEQTTDITDDNIRYESPDKDGPITVTLTNPLSLCDTKPIDKRKFDGQIYICLAKQLYSNITFRIRTDKGLYTITSNSSVFDLENNDFSPINIDLAKASFVEFVIPEAVDLGLSVKWASFNLGASKPEEIGDYYAWGETEPYYTQGHAYDSPCSDWHAGKTKGYDWSSYSLCNGTSSSIIKYNRSDNKQILDLEDDAAFVKLGGNWRMPTEAECRELISNCKWSYAKVNEVKGYLVTSKVPGYENASIFLPWSGFRSGVNIINYQNYGYCLSSSRFNETGSRQLYFNYSTYGAGVNINVSVGNNARCYGYTIRPVTEGVIIVDVTSVSINKSSVTLNIGDTETLTATFSPSNATSKTVFWRSSNTSVATVDDNGTVTAVAPGSAIVTVTTDDGGFTATCTVTVSEPTTGSLNGYDWVDLGLPSGLKWATFNVGLYSPEGVGEYGDYFAWGEIEPKDNYDWSTYIWCNGDDYLLTKYNTDSSYGPVVDNLTILELEDDAAHVNWRSGWRMPTDAEWTELINNCMWTWATQGGVSGRLVAGPNGNSIFLPAAGGRYDTDLINDVFYGLYWSSSLDTSGLSSALIVIFTSDGVYMDYDNRCRGYSVRPVTE
jgi:uncharacterized protein YjdB